MADGEEAAAKTDDVAEVSADDIDLISHLDVGGDDDEKKDDKAGETKDDEAGEDAWYASLDNEGLRTAAGEFESRDDFLKALGIQSGEDWRDSITDDDLREHASRFGSIADVVRGNLDLRQQVSGALLFPSKSASKEERQTFATQLNKMLGVPEDANGYEFPALPEGEDLSDDVKTSRGNWAKLFHDIHLPKPMATAILNRFHEEVEEGQENLRVADERYAEATVAELKTEYGDEYDANREIATRAAETLFGDDHEGVMRAKLSNDRLIMDSPFMIRMLVRIGREINEGPSELLTSSERDTLEDQVTDVRKRAADAKDRGETRLANKLFADEQALLRKLIPNQSVVGAGRNA